LALSVMFNLIFTCIAFDLMSVLNNKDWARLGRYCILVEGKVATLLLVGTHSGHADSASE